MTDRRGFLAASGAALCGLAHPGLAPGVSEPRVPGVAGVTDPGGKPGVPGVPGVPGRLKQSACRWPYRHFPLPDFCRAAAAMGLAAEDWGTLKKHGLVCAIAGSHGFEKGMNNPKYQEMCIDKMRTAIDACAEAGFPSVITFTGFREDILDDQGLKNCVAGYKKVVGYAEEKKVTLCMELLNSKVNHKDYMCDHTEWGVALCKMVGSPRFKLLYDIYHMQIMEGDVIRTIRDNKEWIAHFHTGGVPGRHELNDTQELNWRGIAAAIADAGFTGYLAHEFTPTHDPLVSLREAVAVCTA